MTASLSEVNLLETGSEVPEAGVEAVEYILPILTSSMVLGSTILIAFLSLLTGLELVSESPEAEANVEAPKVMS